jgi:hypothetical protein
MTKEEREKLRAEMISLFHYVEELERQISEAMSELHCCDDVNLDEGLAIGISQVQGHREMAERDAKRYRRIRKNWLDCGELNLHGRLSVVDAAIDAALTQEQERGQ